MVTTKKQLATTLMYTACTTASNNIFNFSVFDDVGVDCPYRYNFVRVAHCARRAVYTRVGGRKTENKVPKMI